MVTERGYMSEMPKSNYVDGLGRVSVIKGMVYVELLQLMPGSKADDEHSYQTGSRLVFNLPSYVEFCTDIMKQLEEMEVAGIITKKQNSHTV